MARIIKRYANRKLYDVTERRYITLDEIGGLIQTNEEIQVLDKVSGKDITELVFSKIAAVSVQQAPEPLPRNLLVGLIQGPSDVFLGYVRKTVSAGFETVHQLDRWTKILRDLLTSGENGNRPQVEELAPTLRNLIEEFVEEQVEKRIADLEIASKAEIDRLQRQIRALERQVKILQSSTLLTAASGEVARGRHRTDMKTST